MLFKAQVKFGKSYLLHVILFRIHARTCLIIIQYLACHSNVVDIKIEYSLIYSYIQKLINNKTVQKLFFLTRKII